VKVKTAIAGSRRAPEICFDKYPLAISPGFSNPWAAKRVDLGAKPFTMAIGLNCFTGAVKFFVMNARPALAAKSGLGFAEYPTPSRGVEWVDYSKRPFGGPEAVLAALYPPRRHLQQPPAWLRRRRRRVQVQGLPRRWPRAAKGHDARDRRVHPPLPHPCPANRFSPHSPLRPVRKRRPRPQHRPRARVARPQRIISSLVEGLLLSAGIDDFGGVKDMMRLPP